MKPGDLVYLFENDGSEEFIVGSFDKEIAWCVSNGAPAIVIKIDYTRSSDVETLDNLEHDNDTIHILVNGKIGWAFRAECLSELNLDQQSS